jgi:predicted KAP-like P-loop ATPase
MPKILKDGNKDLNNFFETIVLFGSAFLTISSFSKNISHSLLSGSSEAANKFLNKSRDPMQRLVKHFGSLIKSIKNPVAIFIDDLDRCEPEFVVKLIEGIQTLFRDKGTKVLFVVAADQKWITRCFELHYSDFMDTVEEK